MEFTHVLPGNQYHSLQSKRAKTSAFAKIMADKAAFLGIVQRFSLARSGPEWAASHPTADGI